MIKHQILIFFISIFIHNKSIGQNNICADSIQTVLHSSAFFQPNLPYQSIATSDNGTLIFQSNQNLNELVFFKTDQNGNPLWAKEVPRGNANAKFPWTDIHQSDNGNILINSSLSHDICNTCLASNHFFLDPQGNPILQADYLNELNDTAWQITNSGPNQTIVFAGARIAANGGGITIYREDTIQLPEIDLNPIWINNYLFSNAVNTTVTPINLYVINNFVYVGGTYINHSSVQDIGIWILQLDYGTGKLVSFKSYRINNTGTGTNTDSLLMPGHDSFVPVENNQFVFSLNLVHSISQTKRIAFVRLDNNFNLIQTPIAISSALNGSSNAFAMLSQYSKAVYLLPISNTEAYYGFIDTTNNVAEQYHVINKIGSNVPAQFNLKNNGTIGMVNPVVENNSSYFQTTNILAGFTTDSGCATVTDTNFITSTYFFCSIENLNWSMLPSQEKNNISLPSPIPESSGIVASSQVNCLQLRICDSIKINGNNNFCFSDSLYSFTATKNNSCLKKTNWLTDTNFVAAINQFNDTSVSLQFKNTGNTFLYATVAGCGITDSLLITIKKPLAKVDIGNDTTLCPNATDSLFTKFAYQKYLWQNGSADSFFIVKNPGTYYVTTTDNCNNISSDTVVIKFINDTLSAGNDIEICKLQDTVLSASDGFINYTWQPADSIIGSALSQRVIINPEQTTTYIVTAQTATGCTLSDTVKVFVNNCLNKLIMPTAFTPNHDGINDIIHPVVYGVLEKYNFSIYNRWGQPVFHSTKQSEGWNGTINGNKQTIGTFVWQCNYQFTGEKEKSERGTFILIR